MEPEVVMGYQRAILTPNAAEFQRLHEKMVRTIPLFFFSLLHIFLSNVQSYYYKPVYSYHTQLLQYHLTNN